MMRPLCMALCLLVALVAPSFGQEAATTTDTFPKMEIQFESTDPQVTDCPQEKISFELVTGFVYSAPADMLDSQPGTLMLTDCIDMCRSNRSCLSVNYETGLCVLFASSADMYPGSLSVSQFPVFTLYVQKTCMEAEAPCSRSWSFERVSEFALQGFERNSHQVESRHECAQRCLAETEFSCRSANYNAATGTCTTSHMDRHTSAGTGSFRAATPGDEYLESNCVDDPVRLCEFQKMDGLILKTVDSVYQDVESLEECKKLCLAAPFRCHCFDYGDTGENVCRLSHHAAATLNHIEEPYLAIPGASTYELSSCYNVTIDCRSGDMVARIKTSKNFNGKIYAKGAPNTCVQDVSNTLEFELLMAYDDVDCNVERESPSKYSTDVVIQHHDMIITSADLGLSVHCIYDLTNKSVSNAVDLQVTGEIQPMLEEERVVDSPNVIMKVLDQSGKDVDAAAVGDMLQLRFEIVDFDSPYEIFVQDLIAMDGNNEKEILLLDSRGCPTEINIMRPLLKVDTAGKTLGASFDAFKFPTSDKVQFRALVIPCLPRCEPVVCDIMDFGGKMTSAESYGRRRRRSIAHLTGFDTVQEDVTFLSDHHLDILVHRSGPRGSAVVSRRSRRETSIPDEMLVEQTIKISDKFGFRNSNAKRPSKDQDSEQFTNEDEMVYTKDVSGVCINSTGLILACSVFLVIQVVLILVWTAIWHRRRHSKLEEPLSQTTTTESLRQLYDSGYPRRI